MRFDVLAKVILPIKAFSTLRADLKRNKLSFKEQGLRLHHYLRLKPTVNDSMEVQMFLPFKSFQTHVTNIRSFRIVT